MDTPLASSTPPPLVPARGPESSWNPDFLLQQPENLDFARPASVARSGEPAVEATRDPIVVATLDRFARRSGAAPQADGARDARAYATLPTRNSPVDADAAFHLAEIAKHIDRLRHTGVIDGDGTAPRTGTPGANSLRIATPADESLASNRPVSRASRTSNAVGEGSPDTAIPMEPLQDEAVANEPVSASADALPKTPAKGDHDINAGKVLENIILRVGINKSNIPWDKTLFLAILAGALIRVARPCLIANEFLTLFLSSENHSLRCILKVSLRLLELHLPFRPAVAFRQPSAQTGPVCRN